LFESGYSFDNVGGHVFFQVVLFEFGLDFLDVVFSLEQVSMEFFSLDDKIIFPLSEPVDFLKQNDDPEIEFALFKNPAIIINRHHLPSHPSLLLLLHPFLKPPINLLQRRNLTLILRHSLLVLRDLNLILFNPRGKRRNLMPQFKHLRVLPLEILLPLKVLDRSLGLAKLDRKLRHLLLVLVDRGCELGDGCGELGDLGLVLLRELGYAGACLGGLLLLAELLG